jgi:hypothetical protein
MGGGCRGGAWGPRPLRDEGAKRERGGEGSEGGGDEWLTPSEETTNGLAHVNRVSTLQRTIARAPLAGVWGRGPQKFF